MYQRTRIKMCGTTSIEDAHKAVELGIDALGFIFVNTSARFIAVEKAREITKSLPPFVNKVGVFVNEGFTEIEEVVDYLGLDAVQLHGDEEPDFCEKVVRAVPSCTVMKAFRVGGHSREDDFLPYNGYVSGFVLDTYVKDKEGGTGMSFDWSILSRLNLQMPYILAGGLHPENIAEALKSTSPYGIDVNSGVEISPGIKDHEKLQRLVERVTAFDASLRQ
jgi:phosphoribosylanthranilate isomerase